MDTEKQESFERAFSNHMGSCRVECACGKTYFDNVNQGYSWDEGELQRLNSGGGIPVCGSIGGVEFEGRTYAECCPCWHDRAAKIMRFIDGHAAQIAAYLNREKQRLSDVATRAPSVG